MTYEIKNNRIFVPLRYEHRFDAKRIKGFWWHPSQKIWSFPLTEVAIELLNNSFHLGIMELKSNQKEIELSKNQLMEYSSKVKPFKHQKYAVEQMFKHQKYGLFLEMGLGKSKCCVDFYCLAKAKNLIDGALVVCPKSVMVSWQEELNKHEIKNYVVLDGTPSQRMNKIDVKKINIINYAGLSTIKDVLVKFDDERIVVILDESSKIKNPKAKRTTIAIKGFTQNIFKFILSGTPITQNPIDIYSQMRFLNPDYLGFKSWYSFRNYYCVMGGYLNYQIIGYNHLAELKDKIGKHSYILKKIDCDELDLPKKIYENFVFDMSEEMKEQYKSMQKDLILELEEMENITAPIILVKLLRLQQILSGVWLPDQKNNFKVKEIINIVKNFSGDQKVIVWCKFIDSIKLIEKILNENNISNVTFYGETKERQEVIASFRDTNIKVFIGQLQTGGMGINLQCASLMVYFENDFSLQNRLQSEDRVHRVGQRNNCTYIDLVYRNTIDEQIKQAIHDKKEIANYLIQSWKGGM